MLRDVVPFEELWSRSRTDATVKRAVSAFVRFIERRLGAHFYYDAARVPFSPELFDLVTLARSLQQHEVITFWGPSPSLPDEPPFFSWNATCKTTFAREEPLDAGGASAQSERAALTATLAEAAERYLWANERDYFKDARVAQVNDLNGSEVFAPERFAGFSEKQRREHPELSLSPSANYLWIRGRSWATGGNAWIPAQIVTSNQEVHAECRARNEPVLRFAITHGLATHETKTQAILGGALELIERDAWMITWLNQITPPQLNVLALSQRNHALAALVQQCARYRLNINAVRLVTDAPAYAIGAVLSDSTGNAPERTVGLKAHRDPSVALEGALLEALRARRHIRTRDPKALAEAAARPPKQVRHTDRPLYWAQGERSRGLDFLTQGPMQQSTEPWEQDSDEQHVQRIASWCREQNYLMGSVSLTKSRKNVTPWHIELVVIPELQPMHLDENLPYLGGGRLTSVPKSFGYTPREQPYTKDPHPFF